MDFIEAAKKLDFDVDSAMERFMGNTELFEKMVKMFPASVYPSRTGGNKEDDLEVLAFIESGDIETAILKAHTLKSMTGNLSHTKLFPAYTKIVDLLRAGKIEEAKVLTQKVVPYQEALFKHLLSL